MPRAHDDEKMEGCGSKSASTSTRTRITYYSLLIKAKSAESEISVLCYHMCVVLVVVVVVVVVVRRRLLVQLGRGPIPELLLPCNEHGARLPRATGALRPPRALPKPNGAPGL